MATFTIQDIYFPIDGQREVLLKRPYRMGSDEILPYLNGVPCTVNIDYIEINEATIEFRYQLSNHDLLVMEHTIAIQGRRASLIGEQAQGVFRKYGEKDTLLNNQIYTLAFSYKDQTFESTFQTKLNPLYTTSRIVREDLGDMIDSVKDERIIYLGYLNSILAESIASEENLTLLEEEEKTPYVFKQFVRYRTEYDIVSAMYMLISGKQGSVSKVLGEFEVERRHQFAGAGVKDMLSDLSRKLSKAEKELRGEEASSPVKSAVRGGTNNPYPLTSPRRTNTAGTVEGG